MGVCCLRGNIPECCDSLKTPGLCFAFSCYSPNPPRFPFSNMLESINSKFFPASSENQTNIRISWNQVIFASSFDKPSGIFMDTKTNPEFMLFQQDPVN